MMFIIEELILGNLPSLIHRRIHTDLFQCQQIRSCFHYAAGNNHSRKIQPPDPHQNRRHGFITACNEHSRIKPGRISVNFNHVCNHISGSQRIIDPVMSLRDSVTNIRCKISCSLASLFGNSLYGSFHKKIQVCTSRMTVSKCTLHQNLRFFQIFNSPTHADF